MPDVATLIDEDERLAQLASDMMFAASLATAIAAANGQDHRTSVSMEHESWRSSCACGWTSELEPSASDAFTATFVEHLEFVTIAAGLEFVLPEEAETAHQLP